MSASGYRRCPPSVFRKGSLPSLAQRDTVLGDTCNSSATSDVRRYEASTSAPLRSCSATRTLPHAQLGLTIRVSERSSLGRGGRAANAIRRPGGGGRNPEQTATTLC